MTSGVNKEEEHMLMVHDHFNEIPTLSNTESGTGWNEENTVHYETLAGMDNVLFLLITDVNLS